MEQPYYIFNNGFYGFGCCLVEIGIADLYPLFDGQLDDVKQIGCWKRHFGILVADYYISRIQFNNIVDRQFRD
jgi:hypothetical protein